MKNALLSKYLPILSDFRISQVLYILLKKHHICGKDLRFIANNNHLLLIKKLQKLNIIKTDEEAKKLHKEENKISDYHFNKQFFFVLSDEFIKLLSKKGLFLSIIESNCDDNFKNMVTEEVKTIKKNKLMKEKQKELRIKIALAKSPRLRTQEDIELIKSYNK